MKEKTTPRRVKKPQIEPIVTEEPVIVVTKEIPHASMPPADEELKKTLKKGFVKVKVLAGTLSCSEGTYEKGEIFEISKEDLKSVGPQYYQIIE
ncbi:MAG: hypothetical protein OEZ40_01655 [Candidatus Bathyarchaeota archaeon]|nr:hypothetical protein [Candidatus Bathyarchaeota archaeon]